ncbi:MAG: hypothetical protein JNK58_07350 [Phycisphaerae bacterium]|nr:hypothetical protein [Phycisphaerae bacterium]
MTTIPSNPLRRSAATSAFTLIEALVASTLLGMVVLAVISAVTTSQQLSFEGQKQILAAMAADDLMAELVVLDYENLKIKDNLDQPVGSIQTLSGNAYTATAWALGRRADVTEQLLYYPELNIWVKGLRVVVEVRDASRTLATIETFIPEPPA